jgi:tetratricopeptide (TPR) repeat protein
MNQEIAVGYLSLGDAARFREYTSRTAAFLLELPYSQELRPAYDHVARMYAYEEKDLAEATKWLHALESKAHQYHDLRALGDVHFSAAGTLRMSGDAASAIGHLDKALEFFAKIGDAKHQVWCLSHLGVAHLVRGDLAAAEKTACRELEYSEQAGTLEGSADAQLLLGQIRLCQGAGDEAVRAGQEAVRLYREAENRWREGSAIYTLGRFLLAVGDREAALEQYKAAIDRVDMEMLGRETMSLAVVLNSVESVHDDLDAFRRLCASWRVSYPALNESRLAQWYLEPAESTADWGEPVFQDEFHDLLSPDWDWIDPADDCWFRVQDGFEMHAANERGLWHINLTAPRLLRPAHGDLAIQTTCSALDSPACGGLVIWKDRESYLRLDVGTGGLRDVFFAGCIENQDAVIGRGQLPADTGRLDSLLAVHLRLERVAERVRALCSVDGESWFSVGEIRFEAFDPVQVGLYANGEIDRLVHPGAHTEGAAIRFLSFRQWGVPG